MLTPTEAAREVAFAYQRGSSCGSNWVSVTVALPPPDTNVLCYGKTHNNNYCAFMHEGVWFYFKSAGSLEAIADEITHWMHLPETPLDRRD